MPAAGAAAAGAAARRPPKPQVDQAVVDVFVQHDATVLYRSWAAHESSQRLTRGVVMTLGLGSGSGVVIHECLDADDKQKYRKKVAEAMIALDHKLGELSEESDAAKKKAEVLTRVMRMICLVQLSMGGPPGVAGGIAPQAASNQTMYVSAQTEEERSYSMSAYTTDDLKTQMRLVHAMYNMKVKNHQIGTLGQFKKVMYAVKIDETWPDPKKLTLEAFRREPSDSVALCMTRYIMTVGVAAVGVRTSTEMRDDGAARLAGYPDQWANFEQLVDLDQEMQEHKDELTDFEYKSVAATVLSTLFKSSSRAARETPSTTACRLCSRIPELCHTHRAQAMTPTREVGKKAGRDGQKKRSKAEKAADSAAEKKAARDKAAADAAAIAKAAGAGGAGAGGGGGAKGGGKFPDVDGALGPNGLARMVGGNPRGDKCKGHGNGGCKFATCSFSHKCRGHEHRFDIEVLCWRCEPTPDWIVMCRCGLRLCLSCGEYDGPPPRDWYD